MPNSRVKSTPPSYNKPTPPRTVTAPSSHVPKPIPSKPIVPQSYTPKPAPTKVLTPSLPCVPKPIPIETITPLSSTSNLKKVLHGGNTNSEVQKNAVSALLNIGEQQKEASQIPIQASEHRYRPDKFHQSNVAVIEDWNKRGNTPTKSTEHVQKISEKEVTNREKKENKVTSCEQILANLVACFDENEEFWQLRNSYIHNRCQKNIHTVEKQPGIVCYSVPYGITLSYYKEWNLAEGSVTNNVVDKIWIDFENSAIGDALLGAPPLVMYSIAYTGKSFLVELIRNYTYNKYETYDLKLIKNATEKYANDLEYALNRCVYHGAVGTVPINSILYIAMCYGYDNDPHAKVVTIVDKENKQHIFVVRSNSIFNSVIQISDGSSEVNALISYRYLVPESTILVLNITRRY
jgi:hypothetical protein